MVSYADFVQVQMKQRKKKDRELDLYVLLVSVFAYALQSLILYYICRNAEFLLEYHPY